MGCMMKAESLRKIILGAVSAMAIIYGITIGLTGSMTLASQNVWAQEQGFVPGNALGNTGDAELWRQIRQGVSGTVSIPDKKAGVLVQADGDRFRLVRNGPLSSYGGWAMLGIIIILGIFYTIRGRIQIESGRSGRTVTRFNDLERFTHWLTASSFIVLAITGLNTLYGKFVLMPIIGKSAFAGFTYLSKLAHNYIGFAFMIGIALMVVIWIRQNLPDKHDLNWIAKGGGMFTKGSHPPAKKFNFGQKMIFWTVVLGGLSLSLTGICLLYPFEFTLYSDTFALMNVFGFSLPTDLTPLQESQLALIFHPIVALIMIVIIIAHIYIGSVGMDGAIEAVTTGEVDENWAREHHSLWLDEINNKQSDPAE